MAHDPSCVPDTAALILRHPPSRRARGALVLFLALPLLLVLGTARPAAAHAVLEGGSVFDGQVLETAPEELFLDFNEAVTAPRGGLRVFDGTGQRVDTGGTFQTDDADDLVRVDLQPDLPDGTYAVTYRVSSADGHPVNGAFVFSVGAEAGAADALLGQVFSSDADRPFAIVAALARWLTYAGVLLVAGMALTVAWLRDQDLSVGDRLRWLARVGGWVVVGASVATVLLQNVLVSGDGVAALVDGAGIGAVLASFVGISAIVRVLGAALVLAGVRRGVGSPLALAGGTAMLASLLLEGHTLTTGPAAVVWGAAAVHVATGATWFGGLVVLAMELRSRRRADDPVAAGRLVARFSSLFTLSVVAVVAAGVALSWAEVRALRALTSTTYGWVLVAKLAAVVPLLAIGTWNNRRLVPALTARRRRPRASGRPAIAGGSDEVADRAEQRDGAWRLLGRTVRVEALIVVVVLALTSVLVALQPAAEAAGITGAFSANQEFPGLLGEDAPAGQLSVTVAPNRAGRNEIHIYLLSDVGRPFDGAEEVTMSLSQPELDIGPIVRPPLFAGKGHYILTGPELSVPGRWELTTEVAISRFDVVSTVTEFTVNP